MTIILSFSIGRPKKHINGGKKKMAYDLGVPYFFVSMAGQTSDGKDACLNVWGDNDSTSGNNVTTYGAENVNSQKWIVKAEDGRARIYTAMASNTQCLDFSRLTANYGNADIYSKVNNAADTLLEVRTENRDLNLYRIEAVNYGRFLTAKNVSQNGGDVRWEPATGGNDQLWKFTTTPDFIGGGSGGDTSSKTISVYPILNQNFDGYQDSEQKMRNWGCALCCGLSLSQTYGESVNHTWQYFFSNYWTKTGYTWAAPCASFIENVYDLATIKVEIDAGRPVVVHAVNPNNADNQHWVVAYGYTNGAGSAADIVVQDPWHESKINTHGVLKTTLAASMSRYVGSYRLDRMKLTRPK